MDTQNVYNMEQAVSVNAFINIEVAEGEVVGFQITARNGADVDRIVSVTDNAVKAYQKLRSVYVKPNGKAESPAPKPEGSEPKAGTKRDYTKPVPQDELPPELEGVTVDVFAQDFDEVEIQPQLDNKASVKFLKDGLKYPVGAPINKWKHEQVIQALAPLGEIDPTKPQKIRVAGEQYWVQGNAYKDQNGVERHYKNLKLVQAIF